MAVRITTKNLVFQNEDGATTGQCSSGGITLPLASFRELWVGETIHFPEESCKIELNGPWTDLQSSIMTMSTMPNSMVLMTIKPCVAEASLQSHVSFTLPKKFTPVAFTNHPIVVLDEGELAYGNMSIETNGVVSIHNAFGPFLGKGNTGIPFDTTVYFKINKSN